MAVVGGRPLFDNTIGKYGSEGPFDATRALGVWVIVLDKPGHFMEGAEYRHLRGDSIAVDVTSDANLPQTLAAAIKGRKIDGIINYYKDETRKFLNTPNLQTLRLHNTAQLGESSFAGKLENLRYPLIAKPCRGGASQGAKRVQDRSGLRQATRQM
ncbi:hypothetical protein TrVFT333_006505 [Trichoderma virens FT-333]|nr:hypothetical protein TrVFT333_006505 [Trichoderma virens FT-333]